MREDFKRVFIANDGQEFLDAESCLNHDRFLAIEFKGLMISSTGEVLDPTDDSSWEKAKIAILPSVEDSQCFCAHWDTILWNFDLDYGDIGIFFWDDEVFNWRRLPPFVAELIKEKYTP